MNQLTDITLLERARGAAMELTRRRQRTPVDAAMLLTYVVWPDRVPDTFDVGLVTQEMIDRELGVGDTCAAITAYYAPCQKVRAPDSRFCVQHIAAGCVDDFETPKQRA